MILRVDKLKSSNTLFPYVVREEMPHRRPSLDHRHKQQCWASHTVVVRSDYCPFLMSTNHPWTDKSRLKWRFETPAEQRLPGNKEDRTAAAKAEERQTDSTAHRCSLEMAAKPGSFPKRIRAELDKLCVQVGRLACF